MEVHLISVLYLTPVRIKILLMKIKVNKINNLTDARYFAAWNVNWIGFSMEIGRDEFISPKDIMEIKEWIVGPDIFCSFGMNNDTKELLEAHQLLNLDGIELSAFVKDQSLQKLSEKTHVFVDFHVGNKADIIDFMARADSIKEQKLSYCLNFTDAQSWTNVLADHHLKGRLDSICSTNEIYISLPQLEKHLAQIAESTAVSGIQLWGGFEEKIGMKDFDELDSLFERMEDMDLIEY